MAIMGKKELKYDKIQKESSIGKSNYGLQNFALQKLLIV